MKKILFIIFGLLFFGESVNSIEIVYPKTNPAKINASSTFFIGSAQPNEKFKINNIEVQANEIGAFAQVVPLSYGINNFKIITYPLAENGDKILPQATEFNIERPQPQAAASKTQTLIEYPTNIQMVIKKDNTPLRSTPVDAGVNRLSNLYKDTLIQVNGEKGGFYRVYLKSGLNGWIRKSDLESKNINEAKIRLIDLRIKEEDDFCVYEFELDAKAPYSIYEENGLNIELFNITNIEQSDCKINVPFEKLIGYDAFYDENTFVIKVRKPLSLNLEEPLKGLKIAIDAGHGGAEAGAIGCLGDKEKDINLAIAQNLKNELAQRGANPIMTRENDTTISLQDRVKLANKEKATILISIHANALPDGQDPLKNRGTSVYYYHNQAKPLAENILQEMTTQLGTKNDKARRASLALVRPTATISVLVEVGYMINPDDYALLLDETFRQNCAKAIADGISKYILSLSLNPATSNPEANPPQQNGCEADKKDEK